MLYFVEKRRTFGKVYWKEDGVPYIINTTTTFCTSTENDIEVQLCLFCTYWDDVLNHANGAFELLPKVIGCCKMQMKFMFDAPLITCVSPFREAFSIFEIKSSSCYRTNVKNHKRYFG